MHRQHMSTLHFLLKGDMNAISAIGDRALYPLTVGCPVGEDAMLTGCPATVSQPLPKPKPEPQPQPQPEP